MGGEHTSGLINQGLQNTPSIKVLIYNLKLGLIFKFSELAAPSILLTTIAIKHFSVLCLRFNCCFPSLPVNNSPSLQVPPMCIKQESKKKEKAKGQARHLPYIRIFRDAHKLF
jgi:hypothetical protein